MECAGSQEPVPRFGCAAGREKMKDLWGREMETPRERNFREYREMGMTEPELHHLDTLFKSLAECAVLLKKDGNFPIEKPGRLAAYGNGVCFTVKGGTGSGEVNSRFYIPVVQGLSEAGFRLTTYEWMRAYDKVRRDNHEQFVKDIKARAKKEHKMAMTLGMGAVIPEPEYDIPVDADADACVYVLSRVSGEGCDRTATPGDFCFTKSELRDILALNERFESFMLVLNVGGPMDLTPVMGVKNILLLSQLGVETGRILAEILLGHVNPSGKLASTWAAAENYPDVGTFGNLNNTSYNEGIYVGYRWFDVTGRPVLFPFGYGLSYSEFRIYEHHVSVSGTKVTVSAEIDNMGEYAGKDVLEVYVSCPQGRLDKPVKELAAFAKSRELDLEEYETVTTSFDLRELASYDEEQEAYILEKGDYTVYVGLSPDSLKRAAVIHLEEEVIVRKVRNLLGRPDFEDWKPDEAARAAAMTKLVDMAEANSDYPADELSDTPYVIPEFTVKASVFETETADYNVAAEVSDEIDRLTDEELCHMTMGYFDPKGGLASVIGTAAATVAGAAGETAKVADFPSLVLSDGPAGVRISPQYYIDKKGKARAFGMGLPESVLEYMPGILQWLLGGSPKLPRWAELKEQYCTAIPVGTALAQSWNTDLARVCGDIVGDEMERFGIDLWLAPALNIHRTPFCGRNFEYYSEDPLMSGLMASAVAEGVQAHSGRGVTVKHFAANNQEYNRYFSNSCVSERAMREIYLKGFGICIRKAQPAAVMSSYNLLNGTHTSESRALCRDILRGEWGFKGICMTDWVVKGLDPEKGTIYTYPDPATVLTAGDLFMPGSKQDYKNLLKGLQAGKVTAQQLKEDAQRILDVTRDLKAKQLARQQELQAQQEQQESEQDE